MTIRVEHCLQYAIWLPWHWSTRWPIDQEPGWIVLYCIRHWIMLLSAVCCRRWPMQRLTQENCIAIHHTTMPYITLHPTHHTALHHTIMHYITAHCRASERMTSATSAKLRWLMYDASLQRCSLQLVTSLPFITCQIILIIVIIRVIISVIMAVHVVSLSWKQKLICKLNIYVDLKEPNVAPPLLIFSLNVFSVTCLDCWADLQPVFDWTMISKSIIGRDSIRLWSRFYIWFIGENYFIKELSAKVFFSINLYYWWWDPPM